MNVQKMIDKLLEITGSPEVDPGPHITRADLLVILQAGIEKSSKFVPPTLAEVEAYCIERKNGINAKKWWNFYSAKGWKIGKEVMKSWKSAVHTWEPEDGQYTPATRASDTTNDEGRL